MDKTRLQKGYWLKNAFKVDEKRAEWFSDPWLNRIRETLKKDRLHPEVTVEIFSHNRVVTEDIDQALAALEIAISPECRKNITIKALYKGERISPQKSIIRISGDYREFSHAVPVCLDVLSRKSDLNSKEIIGPFEKVSFLNSQELDPETTLRRIKMGMVPEGLNAVYGGPAEAGAKFIEAVHREGMDITSVIDINKNCVKTVLEVARRTIPQLCDICFHSNSKNPNLKQIIKAKKVLEKYRFAGIEFIALGNFNLNRLKKTPVSICIAENKDYWAKTTLARDFHSENTRMEIVN